MFLTATKLRSVTAIGVGEVARSIWMMGMVADSDDGS